MRKKVLIADDHRDIREMMKFMLETEGFEAIVAADGYEAVQKTYSQHPDLILMDLGMPVLDGLNATKAIRDFDEGADVPILAVTAYGDFYKEKALDAGCTAVLAKPLEFDDLKALIDYHLTRPVTKHRGH